MRYSLVAIFRNDISIFFRSERLLLLTAKKIIHIINAPTDDTDGIGV